MNTGLEMNLGIYLFAVVMLLFAIEPQLIELEELLEWIILHPVKTFKNVKAYIGGERY